MSSLDAFLATCFYYKNNVGLYCRRIHEPARIRPRMRGTYSATIIILIDGPSAVKHNDRKELDEEEGGGGREEEKEEN